MNNKIMKDKRKGKTQSFFFNYWVYVLILRDSQETVGTTSLALIRKLKHALRLHEIANA